VIEDDLQSAYMNSFACSNDFDFIFLHAMIVVHHLHLNHGLFVAHSRRTKTMRT